MALYNKYRPNTFNEVRGQEHIVTIIKNQIVMNRISHAYLFTGTRGTGKTTIAKLLAKSVNCLNPHEDGSPCECCENCKAINDKTSMDIYELDAASNNSVDDIRKLIETVSYKPTNGMKYNIYIIDEVHMLSAGAFNALLKTLEEPPEYCIFVLCTTELHKIPVTVQSRCQKYLFNRLDNQYLIDNMLNILQQEHIDYDPEAVDYIARLAEGSCRDSLSLLDQVIVFANGKITIQAVRQACGCSDTTSVRNLCWYLCHMNHKALDIIELEYRKGVDFVRFTEEVLEYLRILMLYLINGKMNLDLPAQEIENLEKFRKIATTEQLIRIVEIFSDGLEAIKRSSMKRVQMEMTVCRAIRPTMHTDMESIIERIRCLEVFASNCKQ